MPPRLASYTSALLLVILSGMIIALPLASAQSTVAVTILSGAGSGAGAAPGFSPDTITVVIGVNNTVMWTNDDTASAGTTHTVTPTTEPVIQQWPATGSGDIAPGKSYSFTFTVPGTYVYHCSYHSWMTGTVVVKASASPSPEFPSASLALILFAVIAVTMLVGFRLKPTLGASSAGGATAKRAVLVA